jgi:hypothetical protein
MNSAPTWLWHMGQRVVMAAVRRAVSLRTAAPLIGAYRPAAAPCGVERVPLNEARRIRLDRHRLGRWLGPPLGE